MALTQDMILSFLLERGGKVKNSELVSNFKGFINSRDPAEKKHNRELFKSLVNNVAVVQQDNDVKYVTVKKKHLGFISGDKNCLIESPSSIKSVRDSSEIHNVDIINNNYCHSAPQAVSNSSENRFDVEFVHSGTPSLTARVLNVTSDARSGAVFALVAVKSPSCELQQEERRKTSIKTLIVDAKTDCRASYESQSISELCCWRRLSLQVSESQTKGCTGFEKV